MSALTKLIAETGHQLAHTYHEEIVASLHIKHVGISQDVFIADRQACFTGLSQHVPRFQCDDFLREQLKCCALDPPRKEYFAKVQWLVDTDRLWKNYPDASDYRDMLRMAIKIHEPQP